MEGGEEWWTEGMEGCVCELEECNETGVVHMCQPSRNRAGNPAFWLIPRIPAFLREPPFLALFGNNKNC